MTEANPNLDEIASALFAVATAQPQPARDLLGGVNERLGTSYTDARSIGRGLAHAVKKKQLSKTGSASRPLYAKHP